MVLENEGVTLGAGLGLADALDLGTAKPDNAVFANLDVYYVKYLSL
jgi:hypothetical protein